MTTTTEHGFSHTVNQLGALTATVVCKCGRTFTRHAGLGPNDSPEAMADLALERHLYTQEHAAAARSDDHPTKPGQPVRSLLDGTLGVTLTPVRPNGRITVMFIGSAYDGPFEAADLAVTRLGETER